MSVVGFHGDSDNQISQEESYESGTLINELYDFLKLLNSEYPKKLKELRHTIKLTSQIDEECSKINSLSMN